MRIVLQRVLRASVAIDGNMTASIARGALLLVGVKEGDTEADALKLAKKIAPLRIFSDADGKMNLGIQEVAGSYLAVSQFTLYADTSRGRRPFFGAAAKPEAAEALIRFFVAKLAAEAQVPIQTGTFGADMKVELVNDGPVTIILDSQEAL
jgi:D-tyrosyl-tRNA(Tyr) deacylase